MERHRCRATSSFAALGPFELFGGYFLLKLVLSVEAPEGGDPQNPVPIGAWSAFEPVLEEELLDLFPEMAGYGSVEVSVSILSPDEIRAVNRDYRESDEATDVLSFPMWEEGGCFAPDPMLAGSVLPLGDVMICPGVARARNDAASEEEALCLVLAHSFLHLLAWDHDTEERQAAMWARQERLRDRLLAALASAGREVL